MVALIFLLVIAAVFASILALEGGDEHFERRPAGLLTWIASGNWPAKIGGGLMIVGVGALLRYAVIKLDVPDGLKLGVGIGAAIALGVGSQLLAGNARRRAVSLALGGAAFGVAYLTAYSAFALFGYLPTLQGLGLLALTAVAAGVFAVTRSALSLAVLSMVGAFMAPAFAPQDPGAQVVYGYYVAISVLTLCMVAARGWRPLIHLSFLFTLAGGAFFAWTADYFSRGSAPQLLPMIIMLVAVHVAMPLFERRWQRGVIVESLDTIYLLALPVVAALTAVALAPSRSVLAEELWWFAAIWFAASAWLFTQKREGMATHAVIALLMGGLGLAARFRNLPWELVALAIGVSALAFSARRSTSNRLHSFLAGLVLVLAAVHIISALAPAQSDTVFFNGRFLERLVGSALLVIAALTVRRLRHTLDSLMLTVAIGWSAFAIGAEVARLDLVSAWLLLHWMFALATFALFFLSARVPAGARFFGPLVFALGLSALLAGTATHGTVAWASAIIAAAAMLAIALRPLSAQEESDPSRLLGAIGAPIVTGLWMACYSPGLARAEWQFPLVFAAACAGIVLLAAARARERSLRWFNEAADIFAVGFAFVLAVATIFDIAREPAAVLLELTCVGGLLLIGRWDGKRISVGTWLVPAIVIGIALVLQANLLRWLGPAGELDALSVTKMEWPTLVSLLWASIGAALTIAGRRAGSRVQWSAGAAFLVGAAIKLVLLDFGSLGQLANILAVIAAGGVFLTVGWLAPMPPAREAPPKPAPAASPAPPPVAAPATAAIPPHAPRPATAGGGLEMPDSYWHSQRPPPRPRRERDSSDRLAWTIAIVVFVLFTLTRCGSLWRHPMNMHIGPFANAGETHEVPEPAIETLPDPQGVESPAAEAAPPAQLASSPVESAPAAAPDACSAWARQLPPNYRVFVVNSFDSAQSTPLRGVLIDHPGVNAVLILAATGPTHWKFSIQPGSSLAGVWLTGPVSPQLEDLPEGVPVLDAARVEDSCAGAGTVAGINPEYASIHEVLHQAPARVFRSADSWTLIRSERIAAAQPVMPERDLASRNIAVEQALQRLLDQGAIRRLSSREVESLQASAKYQDRFTIYPDMFAPRRPGEAMPYRVFYVQQAMEFPEGLTGSHGATFLVPRGVPSPSGNPGHSQVVDMSE